MTARPMTEGEHEEALEKAQRIVDHYRATGFAYDAGALYFCQALLSSSSAERRMREALEALSRPDGFARLTCKEEKDARIAFALAALSARAGEDAPQPSATPRFADVSCSHCGQSFGPGDHGFSHCENHKGLRGTRR